MSLASVLVTVCGVLAIYSLRQLQLASHEKCCECVENPMKTILTRFCFFVFLITFSTTFFFRTSLQRNLPSPLLRPPFFLGR